MDMKQHLTDHAFMRGMAPRHMDVLADCASHVRLESGAFLFREGEEADASYFVLNGRVALEIFVPGKGAVPIETISEGGVIGWSWLMAPYRWHFDARAMEPTRAIKLHGARLRQECEADHDLGYEMLKRFMTVVSQRLESVRLQLLDIYHAS